MSKKLTLGSLFDGSAGFPLGGLISGITPLWASEIEPFPVRVTTKRLPEMEHLGDITSLNGGDLTPVDIITFGSPCQDMSVAGKREGLDGSRSSLFYEAIRVIKEMREKTNGQYPRFIVWENVPGAFSSNQGEDFRAVLEEICKVKDESVSIPKPAKWEHAGEIVADDYSIAWRLLDAQFWGVPQRRKRIYLVADFADGCAGKILFESESVSGYSSKSSPSWERTSKHTSECVGETSGNGLVFENHSQDSRYKGPLEVAQTVSSTYGTGGNNQPFVVETPKVYGICAKESNSMKSTNPHSGFYEAETSRCLDGTGGNPSCNQGGMAVVYAIDREAFNCGQNFARVPGITDDGISSTLNAQGPSAVAVPKYSSSKASFFTMAEKELANTLVATDYKDPPIVNDEDDSNYIVRRLTPTECARLQGFPDWWCEDLGTEEPTTEEVKWWRELFETHAKAIGKEIKPKTDSQIIKWLKNPHSDSAEYKMWGNGVALPNVIFVLSGIVFYAQNSSDMFSTNS